MNRPGPSTDGKELRVIEPAVSHGTHGQEGDDKLGVGMRQELLL